MLHCDTTAELTAQLADIRRPLAVADLATIIDAPTDSICPPRICAEIRCIRKPIVARAPSLSKEALVKLGADRLAELVLDEAKGDAPFRRLVMAALAAAKGPAAIAAIVDKRLDGLDRARGAIAWDRTSSLGDDLAATLKIIVGDLAQADPSAAAARLMRFLATADRTLARVGDPDGGPARVYAAAAAALPALVASLPTDESASLADRLYDLTVHDDYQLMLEPLPEILARSPPGVVGRFDARLAEAFDALGPIDENDSDWRRRRRALRLIELRQVIADSHGDVDAFITLESAVPGHRPDANAIAERLTAAGRHVEALNWLRRPTGPSVKVLRMEDLRSGFAPYDPRAERRARLEIRVLEAMGERAEARTLRWKSFEASLDADILRDHLAHLPDFEDVDALDAAFAHALASPLLYPALRFLIEWPKFDLAERLVVERRAQWDGRYYDTLAPAARALESARPLAATILYRLLIDSILDRGQSVAYPHAARYYVELEALAPREESGWPIDPARTYREGLRSRHGRKHGFWSLIEAPSKRSRKGSA